MPVAKQFLQARKYYKFPYTIKEEKELKEAFPQYHQYYMKPENRKRILSTNFFSGTRLREMINDVIEYTEIHHPDKLDEVKSFFDQTTNEQKWFISKFGTLRSTMGDGIIKRGLSLIHI